jgi:hypothetical protein
MGMNNPVWAIASQMQQYVPDIEEVVMPGPNASMSNWLSREALAGKVARREIPEKRLSLYAAEVELGRPPRYEYRVITVRRRVAHLLAQRQGNVERLRERGFDPQPSARTTVALPDTTEAVSYGD